MSRAKGKNPMLETILCKLESFAEYSSDKKGFIATSTRQGSPVKIGELLGFATEHGYRRINFDNRFEYIHRLVWLWHNGAWPEAELDHINGIKTDNNIENLREGALGKSPNALNQRNRRMQDNNTSGYTGVSWDRRARKWVAQLHVLGKHIHIGYFSSKEDAFLARENYLKLHPELGFTIRHGK